jgi:hypothetical protein
VRNYKKLLAQIYYVTVHEIETRGRGVLRQRVFTPHAVHRDKRGFTDAKNQLIVKKEQRAVVEIL